MEYAIYLRAFEPEDYKTTIKWRRDDEIWSMLGGPKYFVSESYEKKWIENEIFNSKDVKLAVCLSSNNLHIGNVYFTNINTTNQSCNSHILIGEKEYWGKGIAKEALLLGIHYMVNERNIHRFEAKILESNNASLKMHQKCGYEIEGLLKRAVYKDGMFHNQYIVGLIR
ncbi:MAG: GNAT family protein [Muribaculaceae bacterium]|nr:GNAT family protein [Muribaculaceae bacterium]